MKADLIKALRRNPLTIQTGQNITGEAADRIEELEAKLKRQNEIYHRQRDTMAEYEAKLDRVRGLKPFVLADDQTFAVYYDELESALGDEDE